MQAGYFSTALKEPIVTLTLRHHCSGWLEKTLCANEVISPSLRYEFEFFFKICSRRRLTSKSSVCRRLTDESAEESAALGFRGIGGARVRRSCGDNGENEVR
ncbi:hypothetical protein YC2023_058516 [Brassica napus]